MDRLVARLLPRLVARLVLRPVTRHVLIRVACQEHACKRKQDDHVTHVEGLSSATLQMTVKIGLWGAHHSPLLLYLVLWLSLVECKHGKPTRFDQVTQWCHHLPNSTMLLCEGMGCTYRGGTFLTSHTFDPTPECRGSSNKRVI